MNTALTAQESSFNSSCNAASIDSSSGWASRPTHLKIRLLLAGILNELSVAWRNLALPCKVAMRSPGMDRAKSIGGVRWLEYQNEIIPFALRNSFSLAIQMIPRSA